MNLNALQREFCAAMQSNFFISEAFSNILTCAPSVQEERLRIYRTSSLGSLQKALVSFFPVCKTLVGDAFFNLLTTKYLEKYPLQHFSVFTLRDHFPEFIEQFNAADSVPYLSDMARYEMLWQHIFYGEYNPAMDFKLLAEFIERDGDHVIVSLPQGSKFLSSVYPLDKIWETCQSEYEGDFSVDYSGGPFYFFFWQEEYRVRVVSLLETEYHFLDLLKVPLPLRTQCEKFMACGFEGAIDKFLPRLFQRGCVRVGA